MSLMISNSIRSGSLRIKRVLPGREGRVELVSLKEPRNLLNGVYTYRREAPFSQLTRSDQARLSVT